MQLKAQHQNPQAPLPSDPAELQRLLRQRMAELEAAIGELESLSSSVSHDLRSPLTVIVGFLDVILANHAEALPQMVQSLLDSTLKAALRMDGLIDDLVRVTQVARGPVTRSAVDIAALVQAILADFRSKSPDRNVDIRVGELPQAQADAALIRQALIHLIANAWKFTRERKNAVVEIGSRVEGGERVYFVRDNGAGFAMERAQKLFGAFQRFHNANQFEGTGIGLSIAHRIVTRHGGRIWAQAAVGEGATFHFTLPD